MGLSSVDSVGSFSGIVNGSKPTTRQIHDVSSHSYNVLGNDGVSHRRDDTRQSHHRRLHNKNAFVVDDDSGHHRHKSNSKNRTGLPHHIESLIVNTANDDDDSAKKRRKRNVYWIKEFVRQRYLSCIGAIILLWYMYSALKRFLRSLEGENLPPDSTLDFLVAGFPKSGTTTLLAALNKHKEIIMDSEEYCQIARPIQQDDVNLKRLNRYLDALKKSVIKEREHTEIARSPVSSQTSGTFSSTTSNVDELHGRNLKLGIKCPDSVKNFKAIHRLSQHSPDCKFVIGVRHPIWFLQSFYNYRVLETHKKEKVDEGIPSLFEIWDNNKNWWDVSPDAPRFELFLSQFGKTDLTVQQMRDRFLGRPMLAVKPNRFRIFLYTMEQLEDASQSNILRRDLQYFLGLKDEIPGFGHENKIKGSKKFPETIDICHPEFDTIRKSLSQSAKETVEWMHTFLDSPDVIVSNRPYVEASMEAWKVDPCVSTAS